MTALAVADLVLVTLAVAGAAAYMVWKIVLRPRSKRGSVVHLGCTLTKGVANVRQDRRAALRR